MNQSGKVIAVCGKICSGKSAYSEGLRKENSAVILSVDEIMLSLFGNDAGEAHDTYTERLQSFLMNKSLEFIEAGVSVILDWGFWTKEKRNAVKTFYRSRNIPFELHYISLSGSVWKERILKRNSDVSSGKTEAYFIDEGLMEKFNRIFETPEREEIDVWTEE